MSAYPHLSTSACALIDEPPDLRVRRVRTERWIAYARAQAALAALEDLLSYPKRTRMPNLMIVGPTNNGKTMIVERFRRSHLPIEAGFTPDGVAVLPVLKIQMPPGADERRFFGALLRALGLVGPIRQGGVAAYQEEAVRVMRTTQVRLLIIDEIHNVLSGTRAQQRRMLNVIRWIGNELQIPLVAVGTAEGSHALQSDEQLANRFEPFVLPPWRSGDEYLCLLTTLETVLPLKMASRLADGPIARKILSLSEGILGEIVTIVTRCAVHAIGSGVEAISEPILDQIGFAPPSERRRAAA